MSESTPEQPEQLDADPVKIRAAAHVILDGLTAAGPGAGPSSGAEATELAFTRLLEVEAIELLYDEDEEELELDVTPLLDGVMRVGRALVAELAESTGRSPEDVVAGIRSKIDQS